jgi:hypothetical protein
MQKPRPNIRIRFAPSRAHVCLAISLTAASISFGLPGLALADTGSTQCRIVSQGTGNHVLLIAHVVPGDVMAGHYRLNVITESRGGRSQVGQQGNFNGEPGRDLELGSVGVGRRQGADTMAELVITIDGQTVCTSVYAMNSP